MTNKTRIEMSLSGADYQDIDLADEVSMDDEIKQTTLVEILAVGDDGEMEVHACPYCLAEMGLLSKYLDQVDGVVHCPYCCMEIEAASLPEDVAELREFAREIRHCARELNFPQEDE